MAKRLKLRISKVMQSCRSKDPSNLPQDPVPSILALPSVNPNLLAVDLSVNPSPPPSKPHQHHRYSFRRHVSSAFISLGRGFTSKAGAIKVRDNDRTRSHPLFKWQKEEKWHVVANILDETPRRKIYNTLASDDDVLALPPPPPPPPTAEKKKRRVKKKKTAGSRLRISTSSADSGCFSSDGGGGGGGGGADEEETETLVSSSRSFSTDSSSEFNPHLETIREAPTSRRHKKSKKKPSGKQRSRRTKDKQRTSVSSTESETPARLSVFKKLIPCSVDGKVKESFAIVKKSEDPYEDFKRSMMEMILEKQMFEKEDLEQLLQCFLSLNSRDYHGMIVDAFTEIWEALFNSSAATSLNHQEGDDVSAAV